MALSDKIAELKMQLHSVCKQKFTLERKVQSLRTKEHVLTEQIEDLKIENELSLSQISELSREISQLKCQNAIINVCTETEKAKIKVQLSNLNKHKNDYDVLFANETTVHREQLKQKEVIEREMERQKSKIQDVNEEQEKNASAIEDECVTIERECSVLLKRNKAIMLKLRRKLINTEAARRELMEKNNIVTNKK